MTQTLFKCLQRRVWLENIFLFTKYTCEDVSIFIFILFAKTFWQRIEENGECHSLIQFLLFCPNLVLLHPTSSPSSHQMPSTHILFTLAPHCLIIQSCSLSHLPYSSFSNHPLSIYIRNFPIARGSFCIPVFTVGYFTHINVTGLWLHTHYRSDLFVLMVT